MLLLKKLKLPKLYPIEWCCLFCGIFLSFYYAWIMDDAYIYFRYAENFVFLHRGLVFNPGEYVEGFASPLWMLFWILVRLVHLNYWFTVKLIAVCSYIVFWALAVIVNRKLCYGKGEPYIVNYPLINLTFTYGVLCYFSSGLETPLVQIAAITYACFFLFPDSAVLQSLIAISPLIRHELLLPFLIAFLWYMVIKKRFPWNLFLLFGATLGTWLVFRIYYYADLFPSVFYLKNEIDIRQGLCYVYDTVLAYFTLPILFLFFTLYLFIRRNGQGYNLNRQTRVMMIIAALSVAVYVIKIGGAPWHFRYLAFSYCLVIVATGGLLERAIVILQLQMHRKFIFFIALSLALFSFMCYPRQLLHHPILRGNLFKHMLFFKISDAAYHHFRLSTTPRLLSSGYEIELLTKMKRFVNEGKKISSSEIMLGHSCLEAYMNFDHFYIHNFGDTEPFLARVIMPSDRPAHKYGLAPLAQDILEIRLKYGFQKGSFQSAADAGGAPKWVRNNLASIKLIEDKIYNDHKFSENLNLVFKRVNKIKP